MLRVLLASCQPENTGVPYCLASFTVMPGFTVALAIVCLTIFSYFLRRLLIPRTWPSLPPGPSLVSLIGEALQPKVPYSPEESAFSRWAHRYGDIVHLSIFNRNIIIINSVQTAIDMQESKGSIYSNRDLTPIMKLIGWGDTMQFSNPGPFHKQQRAYMHKLFGTQVAYSGQYSMIEDESHKFLRHIMASPEDLAEYVRYFVGSIALKMTYGYTVKDKDDPFISSADKMVRETSIALGLGTLPWMLDLFPSLEKLPAWFPGTNFKRLVNKWSDQLQEFIDAPFRLVKEQIAAGTAVPSFTSTLLADESISPEDERAIKLAAMTIYISGADTSVSTIRGFFLAMALNPAVFRKAQEEIDTVVGTQRLPSITDKAHLPYTNALISELFRWIVVAPNGVPHKTSRDDVHAGYFIPKGSIILSNIHFMMNDHRLYKDPECFKPERFLGENPERDPREMAFGFGRRQCPGRFFAEDVIFIVCAMSIATFDIRKKVVNGVVIEPVYRMVSGLVNHPEPYEIDIKPRSTQAAALIQATAHA